MEIILESSEKFTSLPIITDELIINLIYICNIQKLQLNAFEITSRLILLKMMPEEPPEFKRINFLE